jgi:hypothetical protein
MTQIRKTQELRDEYLLAVYELCEGEFFAGVAIQTVKDKLRLSYSDNKQIFEYLFQARLITMPVFGNVTLTDSGIGRVEKEMSLKYAEKEKSVLKALFEKTRNDDVTASELAKIIPVPEEDIFYILKDFNRKGWSEERFVDTASITEQGVTALHNWEQINATIVRDIYNTNIHGPSINQIGGQGNTVSIAHTSNSRFDEAIGSIVDLLQTSSLNTNDKEEALADVQSLSKMAVQPPPNAFERAKLRITAIETLVKGTELVVKLAPYLPVVYSFFESIGKS